MVSLHMNVFISVNPVLCNQAVKKNEFSFKSTSFYQAQQGEPKNEFSKVKFYRYGRYMVSSPIEYNRANVSAYLRYFSLKFLGVCLQ